MWVRKLLLTPIKIGINDQIWLFWPNTGIFGPLDLLPDHKTMRTRCLGGFSVMWVAKLLLPLKKIRIFGPKTAKFGSKLAFLAKYGHFWPIWSIARPKNNGDKLSWWFSVMLVPKLLLTPIKIRLFGPKTAKFGPKSAFLVILGQILPFFAHFVQWPTKNNVNKVPRWVFRYVGNKTFDFSSKN